MPIDPNAPDYKKFIEPYTNLRGGVIEALHALTEEFHSIPPKSLREVAKAFSLTEAEVYGVASFYSFFTIKDCGKYTIRVCRSAPCHIENAEHIMECLEESLGIKVGETTEDGLFTLEWTECVGQCEHAPVFTVNHEPVINSQDYKTKIPLMLNYLRQN